MAFAPMIDQHGLIGDLRTTALIASDGTVDSLCLPDADSPSIFAALLDRAVGGHLSIELTDLDAGDQVRRRQNYVPYTNVLITRLQAAAAITEIRDFMLPGELADGRTGVLVRSVSALHGPRDVRLICWPGFDYARADHEAQLSDDGRTCLFDHPGAGRLRLTSSHDLHLLDRERGPEARCEIGLAAGDTVTWILDWIEDDGPDDHPPTVTQTDDWALATEDYWHRWVDSSTYRGRWAEPVLRSALCLKLLQHEPTGGIVAAPTFGLPEWPGAGRNWDYRFVWLRDAAFVVFALLRIGFVDEATRFTDWLTRRCVEITDGSGLRPVYRLDGTSPEPEEELGHLRGFADSTPIRIGNAAYEQTQLDVLGEVLDGLYLFDRVRPISWELWQALGHQLDWLVAHWRDPDAGIWEMRGDPQQFVSSKLLVWVAFERAVRLARRRGLPGKREEWQREADAAYRWVQETGWNDEVGAYVQRVGSPEMDASALLIPMLRFASAGDPRVQATIDAVHEQLSTDSLLYRYRDGASAGTDTDPTGEDGVGGPEGTFTVCTFWYVENLARAGRLLEARSAFEKVLTHANEVGLFSEQIGPAGEALGNFPQALTHLALISAATTLDRALGEDGRI